MDKSKINILESEDRISTLPNGVLCDILSLLPTRDSVRTSALSTRWRYLFASVTSFRFYDYSYLQENGLLVGRKFTDFIYGVLYRHDGTYISLLELDLVSGCYYISEINSWIDFAISRNVRKIKVMVNNLMIGDDGVRAGILVPDLFTCKSLVDLFLCGVFDLSVPETVYLPNLKTCFLRSNMKFTDNGSAQRLFSSCPKLEELTFVGCDMRDIEDLELNIPSLKSFRFFKVNANNILLNAPNLKYYEYSSPGPLVLCKNVLKSIVRADIGVEQENKFAKENMSQLVNNLVEVKYLSFRSKSMGLLQESCSLLPIFNNLTHLELKAEYKRAWKLFPSLLHKTPCLEVLVIHKGLMDEYIYDEITESEPFCLSHQLKVAMVYVSREDQAEFKWIRFLLKVCRVLEKLTIYLIPPKNVKDGHSSKWRYEIIKLLTFPRTSNTCEVEVPEQDEDFNMSKGILCVYYSAEVI